MVCMCSADMIAISATFMCRGNLPQNGHSLADIIRDCAFLCLRLGKFACISRTVACGTMNGVRSIMNRLRAQTPTKLIINDYIMPLVCSVCHCSVHTMNVSKYARPKSVHKSIHLWRVEGHPPPNTLQLVSTQHSIGMKIHAQCTSASIRSVTFRVFFWIYAKNKVISQRCCAAHIAHISRLLL